MKNIEFQQDTKKTHIKGVTYKLDPTLFPQYMQPELFPLHENERELIYALFCPEMIKIFKLTKIDLNSKPELLFNQYSQQFLKCFNNAGLNKKEKTIIFLKSFKLQTRIQFRGGKIFNFEVDPKKIEKLTTTIIQQESKIQPKENLTFQIEANISQLQYDQRKTPLSIKWIESENGAPGEYAEIKRKMRTNNAQKVARLEIIKILKARYCEIYGDYHDPSRLEDFLDRKFDRSPDISERLFSSQELFGVIQKKPKISTALFTYFRDSLITSSSYRSI